MELKQFFTSFDPELAARIVDELYKNVYADPRLEWFFNKNSSSRMREQFLPYFKQFASTDVDISVLEKHMQLVHGSYTIGHTEFDLFVQHMERALKTCEVRRERQNFILELMEKLRPAIVSD